MAKHAYLSASASHRWLACPPSAKLCAQEEDQSSVYAQQGTCAHELGQYLVEKALGKEVTDPTNNLSFYDSEMQEAAEGYAAFVMEQIAAVKELCPDPLVCVEQTLDFSKWVEHGFGTGDCVIVADDLLQIIDLKYGVGVLVSASGEDGSGNSQLKCYALGALDTFGAGTCKADEDSENGNGSAEDRNHGRSERPSGGEIQKRLPGRSESTPDRARRGEALGDHGPG